ncbi:MAG TPA: 2-dehydropantoate 2-reductase [Stellaceae bacterium]|nr:2-dehydropantoate 2-reductase [Stellaceae bacterium]
MQVAVFGAGAIGGYLAAKLALGGHDVALVARGAALAAIRAQGLKLQDESGERAVQLRAVENAPELGPQPLVIIAVKTYALAAAAPAIASLVGPESVILPAQNGIPWWFPYRAEAPLAGTQIAAADRDGSVTRCLDPARVLGCVVQMAASVTAPGAVRRFGGNTLVLGEPDGSDSARLARIAALLQGAGINVTATTRIRDAVWDKLWGNIAFNPMSVLTGATMEGVAGDPDLRPILSAAMSECQKVAERFGTRFGRSIETRIEEARRLGAFKTSMLQDFENDRPLEIEALVDAVVELGRHVAVATPTLAALGAMARLRAGLARS